MGCTARATVRSDVFYSRAAHAGGTYLYWLRHRPALYVTEPGLIREMARCVSLDLGKPAYQQKGQEPLFGRGVLKSSGPSWAHQRRVIAPQFYMDKVKVRHATPRTYGKLCHKSVMSNVAVSLTAEAGDCRAWWT